MKAVKKSAAELQKMEDAILGILKGCSVELAEAMTQRVLKQAKRRALLLALGLLLPVCQHATAQVTYWATWKHTANDIVAPQGVYSFWIQQTNIADTNQWQFLAVNNVTQSAEDYSMKLPANTPSPRFVKYKFERFNGATGTNAVESPGRILFDTNALNASLPLGELSPIGIYATTNK